VRLLYDWSERRLNQMQRRFDAYARTDRAQIERLVGGHSTVSGRQPKSVVIPRILEESTTGVEQGFMKWVVSCRE